MGLALSPIASPGSGLRPDGPIGRERHSPLPAFENLGRGVF
jgi:hypothetical protein